MERHHYYNEYAAQTAEQVLSGFATPPGTLTNVDRETYPMFGIDYPGMNDVMCGRGGGSNGHIGNVRFRTLVNEHKVRYLSAPKSQKPEIAAEILIMWRNLNPPGRFLTKTNAQSEDSLWHDIGDKKAKEKVSQCLREKTPEIMPLLQKLLQEQKEKEAEGKKKENVPMEQSITPEKEVSSLRARKKTAPDVAPSAPPNRFPVSDHSNAKNRRSRDEVADSMPTAAELVEDIFPDDDDEGQYMPDQQPSSMDLYYSQVQTFLDTAPRGDDHDAYSTTDRSQLMDTMSACSWVRSIKSVDSDGGGTMLMSIVDGMMNDDGPTSIAASRPTMPQRVDIATRSQKMNYGKSKVGTIGTSNASNLSELTDFSSFRDKSIRSTKMGTAKANNLSLMSDMSDFTSFRDNNKSIRSNKMGTAGRTNSNYSTLSELTDISEGLQDLYVSGM